MGAKKKLSKVELEAKIDETIRAIKSSYGNKYNDRDYEDFKKMALEKATNLKQLVIMVENMFDLDHSDAYDMVN